LQDDDDDDDDDADERNLLANSSRITKRRFHIVSFPNVAMGVYGTTGMVPYLVS
jgi:hypothetical protein